jgi:NAD dependent epimerase/dehydratase family enzyme
MVGIYLHTIDNGSLKGAINAASPGIVRMKEFAKTFGKVLNRPSVFPVPKFAIRILAGEIADYVVMSQRTSVDKILNAGYIFKFENLKETLRDLIGQ